MSAKVPNDAANIIRRAESDSRLPSSFRAENLLVFKQAHREAGDGATAAAAAC